MAEIPLQKALQSPDLGSGDLTSADRFFTVSEMANTKAVDPTVAQTGFAETVGMAWRKQITQTAASWKTVARWAGLDRFQGTLTEDEFAAFVEDRQIPFSEKSASELGNLIEVYDRQQMINHAIDAGGASTVVASFLGDVFGSVLPVPDPITTGSVALSLIPFVGAGALSTKLIQATQIAAKTKSAKGALGAVKSLGQKATATRFRKAATFGVVDAVAMSPLDAALLEDQWGQEFGVRDLGINVAIGAGIPVFGEAVRASISKTFRASRDAINKSSHMTEAQRNHVTEKNIADLTADNDEVLDAVEAVLEAERAGQKVASVAAVDEVPAKSKMRDLHRDLNIEEFEPAAVSPFSLDDVPTPPHKGVVPKFEDPVDQLLYTMGSTDDDSVAELLEQVLRDDYVVSRFDDDVKESLMEIADDLAVAVQDDIDIGGTTFTPLGGLEQVVEVLERKGRIEPQREVFRDIAGSADQQVISTANHKALIDQYVDELGLPDDVVKTIDGQVNSTAELTEILVGCDGW